MLNEREDGSNTLTALFDKAQMDALEDGSLGCDYEDEDHLIK